MTVVGTAIRHEGGAAYAMNYSRTDRKHAFRLTDSLISADSTFYERLMITLPDSVITTQTVAIDSMNPQEASVSLGTLNAICNPLRPWGLWSSVLPIPGIRAYSNLVYPPFGTTDSDRKSTRLNSSHTVISYAVFCLKKKKKIQQKSY